MATLGSQTEIVWGKNVTVTAGGDTYAEATEMRCVYSYRVLEQEIAGTFIPAFGTGVFHGEITLGVLYSTDTDFDSLVTPAASGDLPDSTCTGVFTDVAGLAKTLTAHARLNEVEWSWRAGNFVAAQVRGVLLSVPTI